MKRGLILGGGGAKGAYEIGVWKAINELDIHIDAVCGTSIGALNGCLFAQGDYEVALDVWENLKPETIVENGISLDFDFELLLTQRDKIDTFLEQMIKEKRVDVTPFHNLIENSLNEEKLRHSDIDFGLCTLNISNRSPLLITKKEMPKGSVGKYLYASAACFPVFPLGEIDGESYVDGGYYDNLPIYLAKQMGCDSFIAVSLNEKELDKEHLAFDRLIVIQPYHSLTSFLNFTKEASLANIQMGYLDAMKRFNKYDGFAYTFEQDSIQRNSELFQIFRKKYMTLFYGNEKTTLRQHIILTRLKKKIDRLFFEYDRVTFPDLVIRISELLGEIFGFDMTEIYDFRKFVKMLQCTFEEYEHFYDETFSKQLLNQKNVSKVHEMLTHVNYPMVIVFLYKLIKRHKGMMSPFLQAWSLVHEEEVVCAFFLYVVNMTPTWEENQEYLEV